MLEPRFEKSKTVIIDELDEFNEIIFISKGTMLVGYEINKQKRYCIKYKNNCVIGGYGVTYNQRASFIYTSLTDVSGYSVRKENWFELLNQNEEIANILKGSILMNYIMTIRGKVLVKKKRAIGEYYNRKDHQMILASEYKDDRLISHHLHDNFDTASISNNKLEDGDPDVEKEYMNYQINHYNTSLDRYNGIVTGLLDNIEMKDQALLDSEKALQKKQQEVDALNAQLALVSKSSEHKPTGV